MDSSSFEAPVNWADNYGTRMHGYLFIHTSGTYTFTIAGDDQSELWLGTNTDPASMQKIAYVDGWTNYIEWDKYESQRSAGISLIAGQKYYIQVLQKEAYGRDSLSVAWEGSGISFQVIPGSVLNPYTNGATTLMQQKRQLRRPYQIQQLISLTCVVVLKIWRRCSLQI